MAEYYLISQLPSLDALNDGTPVPITEERFLELCNRFLGKKALNELKKLTLLPPKNSFETPSSLIDRWNECERSLRLALGKVRAERMNRNFDVGERIIPSEHVRAASTAIEMDNPMEAEKYLNGYRLEILETMRPMDSFSEDYLYYYGIKLKLILRIRGFDVDAGEEAYRNIYSSVISGDGLEAKE